jgi:membrane peptidoglycan carboxypeptidase
MAFFKLVLVIVVTGALASGFFLPYVVGAGYGANQATDKFLNTSCDVGSLSTTTPQVSHMYASDNKTLIATFFSFNRTDVPLTAIPKLTQQALIDTEDRRFYQHHGVDTRGLARAILNDSSNSTQGASTITEQYVKQVRLYQASTQAERDAANAQTADRKLYEAKCALALEKKYSKQTILDNYFNIAFFGENSYGISAAARTYFDKTPQQLTVPESAVITGLVKDPSLYDPMQNLAASKQRRNVVIANMAVAGDITAAQAADYEATPIVLRTTAAPVQGCAYANNAKISNVGFFCDYAYAWLTKSVAQGGGGLTANVVKTGGLRIVTSLNVGKQNSMQKTLFQGSTDANGNVTAPFPSDSPTSFIMPVLSTTTGQIEAFVTSKHYAYANSPNTSSYTQQPVFSKPVTGSGSTFKYFSLISALTAGAKDSQTLFTPPPYFPKNCGEDTSVPGNGIRNAGQYAPTLSLRNATVQSSNTFFVGLEDQFFGCNLSSIVATAQNLGITSLNLPSGTANKTYAQAVVEQNSYTFTLGQTPVSPLELTSAYSAAANDGILAAPHPILSVTDLNGVTPPGFHQASQKRVMSPWVAREAVDIMTGDSTVQGGTARNQFYAFYNQLDESSHLVASKTGTDNSFDQYGDTNGNSALWFVGLTPTVTAATALYSLDSPGQQIFLPGLGDGTGDTFGAYGATYWINALSPYLKTGWAWPQQNAIAGALPTPTNLIGMSAGDASTAIKAAGFNPVQYPVACGSSVPQSFVAYAGPTYALPGATVYYCLSSGNPLKTAPPPPKKTTPPPSKTPPKKRKKTH